MRAAGEFSHVIVDDPGDGVGGEDTFYPSGSPYRVQRHAANIRERKRMLRCVEKNNPKI